MVAARTIVSDSKHATGLAKNGHPESPGAIGLADRLTVDADRNGAECHPRILLDHNLQEQRHDGSCAPLAPSGDGQEQDQVTGRDQSHAAPGTPPRAEQPSFARRIVMTSAKTRSSGKRRDNLR
jgi:hypothetical protein